MRLWFSLIVVVALSGTACFSTSTPATGDPYYDLRSDDDHTVINATVAAGKLRDRNAVPHLVHNLRHEDPWIRCQSVMALILIRGTADNLGFDFSEPDESKREHAVKRWEQWVQDGAPSAVPTSAPAANP